MSPSAPDTSLAAIAYASCHPASPTSPSLPSLSSLSSLPDSSLQSEIPSPQSAIDAIAALESQLPSAETIAAFSSLDQVANSALLIQHIERRLLDWAAADKSTKPDLDQLNTVSLVLWRITGARKTLLAQRDSILARLRASVERAAADDDNDELDEDEAIWRDQCRRRDKAGPLNSQILERYHDDCDGSDACDKDCAICDKFDKTYYDFLAIKTGPASSPSASAPSPDSAPQSCHNSSSVPVCPTLSPDRLASALSHSQSDADRLSPSTIPPSTQSSIHTSNPSHPSPMSHSSSPQSAFVSPISSCGSGSCVQCPTEHCPTRIALPFSRIKCDGTCGMCRKARTCPWTPAQRRPPS